MQIRVHGIGGPATETVLGLPAGTATEAIWRTDPFGRSSLRVAADGNVAAYHWAPLTSGSRWFALWPLLLPFTVLNVAGWMHAPGRRAAAARWLARSLALVSTALFTAWALLAGQVLVTTPGSGQGVALGAGAVLTGVVVIVSQISRRGFERVEPPDANLCTGSPSGGSFPGLADRRLFARPRSHTKSSVVHAAAASLTFVVVLCRGAGAGASFRSAATDAVVDLGALQLLLLVLFGAATVRRAGWWSLGAFATAALGAALIGGLSTAALRAVIGTCPPGGSAGEPDDVVRACSATTGAPFALVDVFGAATLVALGVAAAIVVRAVALPVPGEVAAVEAGLLPTAYARGRARLAVVPARLVGAAVVAALTFVAGSVVVFPTREPETVRAWCESLASIEVDDWPCSLLPEPDGDQWVLTSSPLTDVAQFTLFGLLTFVLLNLVKSVRASWASPASDRDTAWAVAMRRVGSIWDVLTFWPRPFHPFAVRPYAERAVPELAQLLVARPLAAESIDVRAHSQGSVLVLAALAPYQPTTTVKILSFGSPLVTLYSRAFPAYFSRTTLDAVIDRWTWRNAFRFTDHVGRALFVDDSAWKTDRQKDIALADPAEPGGRIDGHNNYWTDERLEVDPDAERH